jgi:hypothetical protein
MNSDESSENQNSPEITHSISPRLFPLPKQEQGFETKRTLVGLYKQGPLETNQQFAERIVREMHEHLAKSRQRTKRA